MHSTAVLAPLAYGSRRIPLGVGRRALIATGRCADEV